MGELRYMKAMMKTVICYVVFLIILATLAACAPSASSQRTVTPASPRHTIPPRTHSAWQWNGTAALPYTPTHTVHVPARPDEIAADIRGNGHPLVARRDATGKVNVYERSDPGAPIVWHNEADTWFISRIDAGDPNDDGRIEYLLLVWKPDEQGILRSHPFLMGWRGGHYRIIWGGSATRMPMQDCAIGDLDNDGRSELVVLEGGEHPGDAGTHVSVWHWHGWGFQLEWRSALGHWSALTLHDSDGNGTEEIYAQR